jgi:hypothetical protein
VQNQTALVNTNFPEIRRIEGNGGGDDDASVARFWQQPHVRKTVAKKSSGLITANGWEKSNLTETHTP